MLFQTHTVQVAQDVVVSWNVQKRQFNCVPTSASEQVHVTLHMKQTTLVMYSKISVIAQ